MEKTGEELHPRVPLLFAFYILHFALVKRFLDSTDASLGMT